MDQNGAEDPELTHCGGAYKHSEGQKSVVMANMMVRGLVLA